jgi:hypothetical protein
MRSWRGDTSPALLSLISLTPVSQPRQKEYFDEAVADESPKQTKARLAKLANDSIGLDENKFLELVSTAKGNSGSAVTDNLKLQVKLGRWAPTLP